MATTKTVINLFDNFTITGGAGPTTSTAVGTVDDAYGAAVHIKINNGTGCSNPMEVQLEVSHDNSGWYNFGGPLIGLSGSSTSISWGGIEIPIGVEYIRATITHQGTGTGFDVCTHISEITSI